VGVPDEEKKKQFPLSELKAIRNRMRDPAASWRRRGGDLPHARNRELLLTPPIWCVLFNSCIFVRKSFK
jgi:hypothetical protein